jgi:ferric-dicitrate binding protein FerR (iron transport regulator)
MRDASHAGLEQSEMDRLLSGLCDGTLGPEDLRRLGEQIAADPAARRQYLEYLDLHATLTSSGPSLEMPELAAIQAIPLAAADRRRRVRLVRWASGLAAAAALIAIALWTLFQIGNGPVNPHNQSPGPSGGAFAGARLVELQGWAEVQARPGEATEVQVGAEVQPGQTLRTGSDDSFAVLELPDNTRLELSADTQIRLAEDDSRRGRRLILSSGLLRADVRPQPRDRPLVVVTPQAEIVVLGTCFRVAAVPATATEVETEAGTVRLTRLADGTSVDVPAGSSALAAANPDPMAVRLVPQVPAAPRTRCEFSGASALAFSLDGARLLAAMPRRGAVLDVRTGRPVAPPVAFGPGKLRPLLTANARTVLPRERDGSFRILNAETGRTEGTFATGLEPKAVCAVSPDGRLVAGSTAHKSSSLIRFWRTQDGHEGKALEVHARVVSLAFSRDGRQLAAGLSWTRKDQMGRVVIWDVATATQQASLPVAPLAEVRTVAFAPDGRQLVAVTQLGAAYLWDLEAKALVAVQDVLDGWTRPVQSLAYSPDGRFLAAGTGDGRVRLWNPTTNQEWVLNIGPRAISALAFAPDGRTLAVGMGNKHPVTLWDVPAARLDR